jgi:hypothetical protein
MLEERQKSSVPLTTVYFSNYWLEAMRENNEKFRQTEVPLTDNYNPACIYEPLHECGSNQAHYRTGQWI